MKFGSNVQSRFETLNDFEFNPQALLRDYFENVVSKVDRLRNYYKVETIADLNFGSASVPLYQISSESIAITPYKFLITAGLHGGEKGGVEGTFRFLEENTWNYSGTAGFVCYPCLNPIGYILNMRWDGTSCHEEGDMNRNFSDITLNKNCRIVAQSLYKKALSYDCAIDLHETPPDDKVTMKMQYAGKENKLYDVTPDAFYMWEYCEDETQRIGAEVIKQMAKRTPVYVKENTIFKDTNSGGVIFYPEGANNEHYLEGQAMDAYVQKRFTNHSFTTETYANVSIAERGEIQGHAIKLIIDEKLKKSPKAPADAG